MLVRETENEIEIEIWAFSKNGHWRSLFIHISMEAQTKKEKCTMLENVVVLIFVLFSLFS